MVEIKRPPEHGLTKLHWFDLCDYGTRPDTIADDVVLAMRRLTELDAGTPCFIYFGNGKLEALASISHDQESIETINNKGLHIFLFEPMCSYVKGRPHNQRFFSEYDYDIDLSLVYAEELDTIKEYVVRNNLKNVKVHTCEHQVDFYFYRYSPYMELTCDDLFLKSYTVYNTVSNDFKYDFQNRFISFIWRWGTHRNIIAAYLTLFTNNFTWYYNTPFDLLKSIDWFRIEELRKKDPMLYLQLKIGSDKLIDGTPFTIDIPKENVNAFKINDATGAYWPKIEFFKQYETPAFENQYTDSLQQYYINSFCDIVTETRFAQHCGNFSEKVLQPIKYRRPFILVAPPFTLAYLRTKGITTFSEYWDESYDVCTDHQERMIKILKLIEWMNNIPMHDLEHMFHDMWMRKIFHNNYNAMLEMTAMKCPQDAPTDERINPWKK